MLSDIYIDAMAVSDSVVPPTESAPKKDEIADLPKSPEPASKEADDSTIASSSTTEKAVVVEKEKDEDEFSVITTVLVKISNGIGIRLLRPLGL